MAGKGFAGKKAAPFVKGGGRSSSHPNTASGKPRKKSSKKTKAVKPPSKKSQKY